MTKRQPQSSRASSSESGIIHGLILGAAALTLVQCGALALGVWGPVDGTFSGPDSYMRLHRILECWGGPQCTDGVVMRSNAPYGDALHWPWLWDWLLIAGSFPFRLFLGPQQGLHLAAYLSAPLLGLATIGLLSMMAVRLSFGNEAPYIGLLLVTQPYVIALFSYARPDHHAVQATLFTVALVATCYALLRPTRVASMLAGAGVGVGLWISTEGLITALPLLAALGLQWVARGTVQTSRNNLTAVAVVGALCMFALFVDGPEAGILSVEYDRISIVHLVLFGLMSAFWAVTGARGPTLRPIGRLAAALGGAAGIATFMALFFPGFWKGPAADFPTELWTLWLDHTAEYVPLVGRIDVTEIMMAVGPFIYGLPLCIWAFFAGRRSQRVVWLTVGSALLWFQLLATFEQVRWEAYVHLLSTLPLAWGLSKALSALRNVRPLLLQAGLRVAAVCIVAIGPVTASAAAGAAFGGWTDYSELDACEASTVIEDLRILQTAQGEPALLLAPIFWGPEVLYRTRNHVVATPYHRNVDGIMDSHRIMSGTSAQARAIVQRRGITHIAFCPDLSWLPLVAPDDETALYGQLVDGNYPEWARPIEGLGPAGPIRILEVEPHGG